MQFVREDWTLFRNLNTLGQRAGVSPGLLSSVVLKELVDNALDIAGNCRIDTIYNELGYAVGFAVEDDGPGMPGGTPEENANYFSISRPLISSKLWRLPTRGALGNGLRVVAGYVIASGGDIAVCTKGERLDLHLDGDDGKATIEHAEPWTGTGTRIEVIFKRDWFVDAAWAQMAITLAQGGDGYKGRTSPHWYDDGAFYELCHASTASARELVAAMDGCTGAKAGKVAAAYRGRMAHDLSREETSELLKRAREDASPVNPVRLGAVGKIDGLPAAYAKVTGTISYSITANTANIPYCIEVWAEVADHPKITLCVNRTPITGNVTAHYTKGEQWFTGCGFHYEGVKVGRRPARLVVNIQTPYMPITTDGKEPDLHNFCGPMIEAMGSAIARAKRQTGNSIDGEGKRLTQKDIVLLHLQEAADKASGNGRYRFSQRQLFYAIRPHLLDAIGKEPDYGTFNGIITDYEAEYGDIKGMYRDPRGTLYHPHTHDDIQLGTISVEKYQRPEWTFNKILFIEKEGFCSLLKEELWPERHDCALVSTKGLPTRAIRDLFDLLGDTNEKLTFFCVHDADSYGTLIYQSLQEATRARPGRRVKVINLGLEPWEALEMDLDPERVDKKDRQGVAGYVRQHPGGWEEWLQHHRVELNAMDSATFLEWLDRKMHDYDTGKLIPPDKVLSDRLEVSLRANLNNGITAQVLAKARIDDQVAELLDRLHPDLQRAQSSLQTDVKTSLQRVPTQQWVAPVAGIAERISREALISMS